MILSPSDLLALCQRHGASPAVARIAAACALVESGGETEAVGDNGHSIGLWQLHDQGLGAGMTVAARQDPDTAAAKILPVFAHAYADGQTLELTGERLARYTAMYTERPAGFPDLDSPAANRYAAQWRALADLAPLEADPRDTQIADLVNLLGYLRGDVADALQAALDSARAATTKAARTAALDAAQAALDTLKRGGA